jgi:hypothetical protein
VKDETDFERMTTSNAHFCSLFLKIVEDGIKGKALFSGVIMAENTISFVLIFRRYQTPQYLLDIWLSHFIVAIKEEDQIGGRKLLLFLSFWIKYRSDGDFPRRVIQFLIDSTYNFPNNTLSNELKLLFVKVSFFFWDFSGLPVLVHSPHAVGKHDRCQG